MSVSLEVSQIIEVVRKKVDGLPESCDRELLWKALMGVCLLRAAIISRKNPIQICLEVGQALQTAVTDRVGETLQ